MNKRLTNKELNELLHHRENEVIELTAKLDEANVRMWLEKDAAKGEGYKEAIQEIIQLARDIFAKRESE